MTDVDNKDESLKTPAHSVTVSVKMASEDATNLLRLFESGQLSELGIRGLSIEPDECVTSLDQWQRTEKSRRQSSPEHKQP